MLAGPPERPLPDARVERSMIEASDSLRGQRISFVGLQATINDALVRMKLQDSTVTTSLHYPHIRHSGLGITANGTG